MKNMALPVGDVNLRFTCCTYLAYTKTTPSYCRKYDNIGEGGLLKYCQNDYQGYGGPEVYLDQRRRMNSASLPGWHDDSISNKNEHLPQHPVLMSVDIIMKSVLHHKMRSNATDFLEINHPIQLNINPVVEGQQNHIKLIYDTGYTEEFTHNLQPTKLAVPPVDLFNENLHDGLPSTMAVPNQQMRFIIDGSHGNITKIDINPTKPFSQVYEN